LIKGIIFDFDGVIVQSLNVKTDAFAQIYKDYGSSVVNKVITHHKANGGMSRFDKFKFYHKTFLNLNINDEEIVLLSKQFSDLVVEQVINAAYVPGVLDYIKKCFKKWDLFISTGTPKDEIKEILIKKGIDKYFIEVFGSPENKESHIDIILSKYFFKSEELIFYGDSNSDLDAAEYANIPFVLIKNDFNQKLSQSFDGKVINNFLELS